MPDTHDMPHSMKTDREYTYWAAADADQIGSELVDRKEKYYRFLRASGQLELWRTAMEKYFAGAQDLGKIKIDGQDDEQVRLSVNHVRNVAQVLLNNITQQKITFQPKAINTDSKSQTQTILAKGVLEYAFKDKHVDTLAREVVDMTLALGEGGVFVHWDDNAGEPYGVDPITGAKVFTGDIRLEVLNPLDIIRDYTAVTTRDPNWIIVRRWKNKFDLAAEFAKDDEEMQSLIINSPGRDPNDIYSPLINVFGIWNFVPDDADDVGYYEFFHKPTPALPQGRHVVFVNSNVVIKDESFDLRKIPVFRTSGGNHFGRAFGYTNIFDCLSVQAGVDALYSSIATNNTMAIQNIAIPNGAGIKVTRSRGGMNVIKFDPKVGKPEALQLTQTAPESYQFLKILEHNIELLSGVNSVARGQPESSLKSGAALALVQSQTIAFAQGLNASYVEFLEDLASMVVEMYQKNATVEQTALIVGRSQRSFVKEFTGQDLDRIVRITIDLGSAMANSLAGRTQMAEQLLQYGGITKEEYLMVMETGKLENMTEGPTAELLNIRSENERLSDGQPAQALIFDNHPLHIKEHHSLVSSPEARENPSMVEATLAHIQEHVQLWFQADPNVLAALGIQPAPQPPPPPPPPPPQPIPAIVATASDALARMMDDPNIEPKDRIAAAQALMKSGEKLTVPSDFGQQPPSSPTPIPSPGPTGSPPLAHKKPGRPHNPPHLAGVLQGPDGPQHIPETRMPKVPTGPGGQQLGPPLNGPVPPGVGPASKF